MQHFVCIYRVIHVIIVMSNDDIFMIKNNMTLLNGKNMQKNQSETQLSEVWNNLLPTKFPKTKCIEALASHLGIEKRNAYARILENKLLAKDVNFLFHNFGIAFTNDRGFFFDDNQYNIIQEREGMEEAKLLGLSKSVA